MERLEKLRLQCEMIDCRDEEVLWNTKTCSRGSWSYLYFSKDPLPRNT
jgi:hypothetical protein